MLKSSRILLSARSGRNTETRTEGIATVATPDESNDDQPDAEEKHRDPNRGDCDDEVSILVNRGIAFSGGETPRPEPRGLRPY